MKETEEEERVNLVLRSLRCLQCSDSDSDASSGSVGLGHLLTHLTDTHFGTRSTLFRILEPTSVHLGLVNCTQCRLGLVLRDALETHVRFFHGSSSSSADYRSDSASNQLQQQKNQETMLLANQHHRSLPLLLLKPEQQRQFFPFTRQHLATTGLRTSQTKTSKTGVLKQKQRKSKQQPLMVLQHPATMLNRTGHAELDRNQEQPQQRAKNPQASTQNTSRTGIGIGTPCTRGFETLVCLCSSKGGNFLHQINDDANLRQAGREGE